MRGKHLDALSSVENQRPPSRTAGKKSLCKMQKNNFMSSEEEANQLERVVTQV